MLLCKRGANAVEPNCSNDAPVMLRPSRPERIVPDVRSGPEMSDIVIIVALNGVRAAENLA
jgi:hypothetical protein